MSLVSALEDQLNRWDLDGSPEGAAALDLAERLAAADLRPAAAAMLHAQLGARLADLRKLAPIEVPVDEIEDLKARVITLLPPVEESG